MVFLGLCLATIALAAGPPARPPGTVNDEPLEMPSPEGQLNAGEVKTFPFLVPEATTLHVLAHVCPGVQISARTPKGETRSAADANRLPGFHYEAEEKEGFVAFELADPPRGPWTLVIDAKSSASPCKFATVLMVDTPYHVRVEPSSDPRIVMGQSVPVSMWVEREGKVVTGTKWKCDLVLYERHLGSVAVSDDGAHGDGPAGDGVFGAAIVTGKTKGHHEVRVEATLPAALGGATIDGIGLFEVYTIEDLVAVPGSVTLSKSPALEGDRVEILGTIANHGSTRVPNLEVEFEDGGGELGAVNVDLAAGETCDVELPWTVTPGASHDLAVYVSPFALDETDFANNTSRTTVVMGQPLPRREGSGDHPCKTVTGTVAPTSPQKPQRHPH